MDARPDGISGEGVAVIVGAFVRTGRDAVATARAALGALPRIEVFDIDGVDADADAMLGVLVEADDLDEAHARVQRDVRTCAGVLGVWPICVDLDGAADASAPAPRAGGDRHQGDDS